MFNLLLILTVFASWMQAVVSYMCSDSRAVGTKGHQESELMIHRHLRDCGVKMLDCDGGICFPVGTDANAGHNVAGMMEGYNSVNNSSYILVCSYYDNFGEMDGRSYDGADSNASGVAMMLDIAQKLRTIRKDGSFFNSNIIFIAFDGYIDGRAGSKAFYKALIAGHVRDPFSHRTIYPRQIKLVVSLEQVGTSLAPVHPSRPDYLLAIGEWSLPPEYRGYLDECNTDNLDVCKNYYGSQGFTESFWKLGDRRPFADGGLPLMYFTSGITDYNNTPYDTPSTLDYPMMEKRSKLITAFICRMVGVKPRN